MTKEDAKQVLLAYRPGLHDHDDPEVAEALELAQQDAGLQNWLQDHIAFQKSVRSQLRAISPPPGLKERILARPKIVVMPFWRRSELWLAAACLATAVVIGALYFPKKQGEETFSRFEMRMVGFALRVYGMDVETNNLADVQQYLRSRGAPAEYALSPALKKLPVKGGARLAWQGHPVAMVCFDLAKSKTLWMFVMEESALPRGDAPGPQPIATTVRGVSTIGWSRDGKVYLIAAPTDPRVLQGLL